MADIEIDISGMKDLTKALKSLEPKVRRRVLRGANRAAANVIGNQARKNAPKRKNEGFVEEAKTSLDGTVRLPGYLKKNIRTLNLKEKNPNTEVAHGVGFKSSTAHAYGTALEMGNSHQAANPFMRPAFDAKADEAGNVFDERAWRGIKKEWDKNG